MAKLCKGGGKNPCRILYKNKIKIFYNRNKRLRRKVIKTDLKKITSKWKSHQNIVKKFKNLLRIWHQLF